MARKGSSTVSRSVMHCPPLLVINTIAHYLVFLFCLHYTNTRSPCLGIGTEWNRDSPSPSGYRGTHRCCQTWSWGKNFRWALARVESRIARELTNPRPHCNSRSEKIYMAQGHKQWAKGAGTSFSKGLRSLGLVRFCSQQERQVLDGRKVGGVPHEGCGRHIHCDATRHNIASEVNFEKL